MLSFKQIRNLHKWPGILFLFPAFLISLTAILLALDGVLHLDKVKLSLPAFSQQSADPEVRAMVVTPSVQYIGTKTGLFIYKQGTIKVIPELSGNDIRSLMLIGDSLFIASKQGLWLYSSCSVKNLLEKDVTNVSLVSGKFLLVSLGRNGYKLIDFNGRDIKQHTLVDLNNKVFAYKQPQTLHKLIMDLHTGEAIVGKTLKPWWIALCGLELLVLTLTGCWFVFKKKVKKVP